MANHFVRMRGIKTNTTEQQSANLKLNNGVWAALLLLSLRVPVSKFLTMKNEKYLCYNNVTKTEDLFPLWQPYIFYQKKKVYKLWNNFPCDKCTLDKSSLKVFQSIWSVLLVHMRLLNVHSHLQTTSVQLGVDTCIIKRMNYKMSSVASDWEEKVSIRFFTLYFKMCIAFLKAKELQGFY